MAENKTRPTDLPIAQFLAAVEPARRRDDAKILLDLFQKWTGLPPVIWGDGLAGSGIVGFGRYHYKYESGREGDSILTGFAPRKTRMAIYIMPGFSEYKSQLARLGPHKHSVSCLYITNLDKIDLDALGEIVTSSMETMKGRYSWWEK